MGLKNNSLFPRAKSLGKFTTTGQMDTLELDIHHRYIHSDMLGAIFAIVCVGEEDRTGMFEV